MYNCYMNTTTIENFDIIKQALYSTKLSRMLAQENIGVVFDSSATTASFDPTHRTLTFPHSSAFLDHSIHEMFMFHEVSHALHIPNNWLELMKKSNADHTYMNIVLDIRDERLIKKRYPGCIKTFSDAYEKLLEQEFFGKRSVIAKRCFADRLNVYAKCGIKVASFIHLNQAEQAFYERCMAAETFDECIALSKELERMDSGSDTLDSMLNDIIERYVLKNDDDDSGMSAEDIQKLAEEEIQSMREERVQDIFNGNFEASVLTNAHVINYESISLNDVKITRSKSYAKTLREEILMRQNFADVSSTNAVADITAEIRELRKNIQTSVDSMIRVFESRKAAEQYKNIRISDTGMIDVNKVHRYQFDDKIFRRSAKIPNAKNHAYYILIDMSGSMSSIFNDVVEQVIVLTEFMRRIQVPYKVVGFGANVDYPGYDIDVIRTRKNSMLIGEADLFEVMSHEQTTSEHNMAIYGLLHKIGFELGGTPTGYAMVASEQYANAFFTSVRADKKHMIVLTDGEPTDLLTTRWQNVGKNLLIVDPVTKKIVSSKTNSSYAAINAIGKIFEYRHNINFTTICISNRLTESVTASFISASITDMMKSQWRTSGFTKMIDPYTKNEVYFAKPFGVETDVGNIDGDMSNKTASQIARSILKNLKTIKKSRSFLNAIAEKIS